MKTKKSRSDSRPATIEDFSTKTTKPVAVEEPQDRPAAVPDDDKRKERFQLSFDLNADGLPDLSTMREGTKKKVQDFFADPRMAQAFGSRPAGPAVEVFHPAIISGMYDILGAVEVMAFGKMLKIPEPVAKQVFTYSPAEKDALGPPTIRVLNKYVPDWMLKYQDEFALFSLLTALTISKINAARALAAMYSANTAAPVRQEENDENTKKTEVM